MFRSGFGSVEKIFGSGSTTLVKTLSSHLWIAEVGGGIGGGEEESTQNEFTF